MKNTPHSPKLQHYWSLSIRFFCVIYRTFVGRVLPLCRDAVGVFYSPSQLDPISLDCKDQKNSSSCCFCYWFWLVFIYILFFTIQYSIVYTCFPMNTMFYLSHISLYSACVKTGQLDTKGSINSVFCSHYLRIRFDPFF